LPVAIYMYMVSDNSLAQHTSDKGFFFVFDGENISFDASLVI